MTAGELSRRIGGTLIASTEEQEPKEGIDYNGTAISIIDQSNDTFWGTQWRTAKPAAHG